MKALSCLSAAGQAPAVSFRTAERPDEGLSFRTEPQESYL